jgi:hypothetical protein
MGIHLVRLYCNLSAQAHFGTKLQVTYCPRLGDKCATTELHRVRLQALQLSMDQMVPSNHDPLDRGAADASANLAERTG